MLMKKIPIYILLVFNFFSCEEAINLNLDTDAARLVIDGHILKNFDEDGINFTEEVHVNLSLTRSFFSETPIPIKNAEVLITAMNTNEVFILNHTQDGAYNLENTVDFEIDSNEFYKLEVSYNGEIYEAIEQLQTSTPIIEARQIKNPGGFNEENFVVEITFQDKPSRINYFVFDFGGGDIFSIDDNFIEEGASFTFLNNFEDDIHPELTVKIIGADERFAIYVDDLSTISGDNGGAFGVVPFKVRGNIVNKTNSDNFPFGYFRVNEVQKRIISLVKSPLFFDE